MKPAASGSSWWKMRRKLSPSTRIVRLRGPDIAASFRHQPLADRVPVPVPHDAQLGNIQHAHHVTYASQRNLSDRIVGPARLNPTPLDDRLGDRLGGQFQSGWRPVTVLGQIEMLVWVYESDAFCRP